MPDRNAGERVHLTALTTKNKPVTAFQDSFSLGQLPNENEETKTKKKYNFKLPIPDSGINNALQIVNNSNDLRKKRVSVVDDYSKQKQ